MENLSIIISFFSVLTVILFYMWMQQRVDSLEKKQRELSPSSIDRTRQDYPPLRPPQMTRLPINIVTQGETSPFYQRVGIVLQESDVAEKRVIMSLYERPTYRGSNTYEYYVELDGIKIPLKDIKKELDTDDTLTVPGFIGEFKVLKYDQETPKYIPYIV